MFPLQCPFCDHPNPGGAKFCNDCGMTLHLKPCHQCTAVNHSTAKNCHKCGTELPELPRSLPPRSPWFRGPLVPSSSRSESALGAAPVLGLTPGMAPVLGHTPSPALESLLPKNT